jgi:O-antigen/teichoic acid export membrane protein
MEKAIPAVANSVNPLMQRIETQPKVSMDSCVALSSLSLRQNFSWTLSGNLAYTACQWGIVIVLAKLGSPVLVGQFALGLAVTAPIFIFLNMQLRTVQVTDDFGQFRFGDYLGLRVATIFIALNLIVMIVFAVHSRRQTALVIVFLGLAKGSESLTDIFYGLMQRRERMDRIAKSMMTKGIVSLAALSLAVYYTRSAVWGAAVLALAWVAVTLAYDIPSSIWVAGISSQLPAEALWPRWDRTSVRKLIWLALPLALVAMLVSLNSSITRYFVQGYLGERQLGIFAALASVQGAAATVEDAIAQSALSHLSRSYASNNRQAFRTLLFQLLVSGAGLGVCGVTIAVVLGRPILAIFYGPEYAGHVKVFVWIAMAIGVNFLASFMLYGVTAARYFRSQLPLSLTVTATGLIACAWFIPKFGILGAAYALLLTALARALLAAGLLVKALGRLASSPACP